MEANNELIPWTPPNEANLSATYPGNIVLVCEQSLISVNSSENLKRLMIEHQLLVGVLM